MITDRKNPDNVGIGNRKHSRYVTFWRYHYDDDDDEITYFSVRPKKLENYFSLATAPKPRTKGYNANSKNVLLAEEVTHYFYIT